MFQRLVNSVLMTKYEYKYFSVLKSRPNTNTNIIWFENIDRIRIVPTVSTVDTVKKVQLIQISHKSEDFTTFNQFTSRPGASSGLFEYLPKLEIEILIVENKEW